MNAKQNQLLLFGLIWLLSVSPWLRAQDRIELRITASDSQLELSWPARLVLANGVVGYPAFAIQRSDDLKTWVTTGPKLRGNVSTSGAVLKFTVNNDRKAAFYRVAAHLEAAPESVTASGGAEVFGYAPAFAKELQRIGQLPVQDFSARSPAPGNYLAALSWDPTTALFWDAFAVDPAVYNIDLIGGLDDLRSFDFRLTMEELAVFKEQGFVVSERLGAQSFGELFYRLWTDDLPVFVSTDAMLQAWHRSYDAMLSELEETLCFWSVENILSGIAAEIPKVWAGSGPGVLKDSLMDADYFVAVARSLLAGTNVAGQLNQDARVAETLRAVKAEQLKQMELFGQCRMVDFSQFKVRGHYEDSERLRRYFQAVMWLGRIDFRIAGGPFQDCPPPEVAHYASPREMGTALVLTLMLKQSGQFDRWLQFDRLIQAFVGWTDSMTFAQLSDLLAAARISSPADIHDLATLEKLQAAIEQGQYGVQNIRGDYFVSPLGPDQIKLPQSFTVFGQKFILDSWALAKVVYDEIIWDLDGIRTDKDKIPRRVPSSLDVGFSVLANDQVVPELVARITATDGHQFRDGLPYQHNLAAVRTVIDGQNESAWNQNVYMNWLATLRELSTPTTGPQYPESMRTRSWAMKTLNTQLASWTQLRHDTILYAKQSYTGWGDSCSYPAGFVEPRTNFWRRLKAMAENAASMIQNADYQGVMKVETPANSGVFVDTDLKTIQTKEILFLKHFAEVVTSLLTMAEKELAQQPFTREETSFLRNILEYQTGYLGRAYNFDGWYPKLFYRSLARADWDESTFQQDSGSVKRDALVADVHTDVPCPFCDPPDPGSVLHEGVGNVNLLMIAVDNGADRMVYAGPVLSHYEFELIGPPTRKSDSEWRRDIDQGKIATNPDWTRSYLVPGKQP